MSLPENRNRACFWNIIHLW